MEVGWAMVMVLALGMAQGCFCNHCHSGTASHHHCHNMHQDLCNCRTSTHHPTRSNSILCSMMVSAQEVSVALELASVVVALELALGSVSVVALELALESEVELVALEQVWVRVPKDALQVPELSERTQEHHQLDNHSRTCHQLPKWINPSGHICQRAPFLLLCRRCPNPSACSC